MSDWMRGDGYDELRLLALEAVEDAASGKGKERHAGKAEPIDEQQIVKFGFWMASPDFNIGQAAKKAFESKRLPPERAIRELFGAVNYLLCGVKILRKLHPELNPYMPVVIGDGSAPEVKTEFKNNEEMLAEIDRLTEIEVAKDAAARREAGTVEDALADALTREEEKQKS